MLISKFLLQKYWDLNILILKFKLNIKNDYKLLKLFFFKYHTENFVINSLYFLYKNIKMLIKLYELKTSINKYPY